jgi:hypothetical protein
MVDGKRTDRSADDARGTQGQREAFGSDGSDGTFVTHVCAPDGQWLTDDVGLSMGVVSQSWLRQCLSWQLSALEPS